MSNNILSIIENAIETLMNDSLWAEAQDIDSLTKALKSEIDEFTTSFTLEDKMNTLNEAGDVIMLLLCCLKYQIGKDEKEILNKVLLEIKSKLYRRFSHLYKKKGYYQLPLFSDIDEAKHTGKQQVPDKDAEDLIWAQAKQKELQEKFAFCLNEECKFVNQIGSGNIILTASGKIVCKQCNSKYLVKNSTLFSGRTTSREKIITSIAKLFHRKYFLLENFNSLDVNEKRNIKSWIIGSLKNEKALKNLLWKRYGIFKDETEELIKIVLKSIFFKVRSTHAKKSEYFARSWNKQEAIRYILAITKYQSIEAMNVFHYSGEVLRDLTVEISNMYGCPVGCAFCASTDNKKSKPLNSISYLKQVNTCLEHIKVNVSEMPDFQVSFAGIGEPSLVANDVLNGGLLIYRIYPNVRFNIATCGINLEAFDVWKNDLFKIRTLQIPYYHYKAETLKLLFLNDNFPPVSSVLPKALHLSFANEECRVKINYILIKNYNDSVADIDQFLIMMEPYRESITIKLSFLNPTTASKRSGLHSPPKDVFRELYNYINDKGFSCYIFGTAFDPQIGCGQLASQLNLMEPANGYE